MINVMEWIGFIVVFLLSCYALLQSIIIFYAFLLFGNGAKTFYVLPTIIFALALGGFYLAYVFAPFHIVYTGKL